MLIMLCSVSMQVSVGGGTRRPETTGQSQERRRQHAAAALAGLNHTFNKQLRSIPKSIFTHTNTLTYLCTCCMRHAPWKHLPPEKAAAAAVGFLFLLNSRTSKWADRTQINSQRREGRFLMRKSILRATDGVLYIRLFNYLSSANSKNCKLTSLNNPAPRYGAGKENKHKCKEKELWRCHTCENSVSYSCTEYGWFEKGEIILQSGLEAPELQFFFFFVQ